jgi:hypothetical protein
MLVRTIMGSAATAAFVALLSLTPAQAAMSPSVQFDRPSVQRVDCAVGFHIGPAGGCIIGTEEHHDTVIEKRGASDDCATKTVKRTNGEGDSVTKSTTNCD